MLLLRGTHRKDRHGDPADEIQTKPLAVLPPPPGFLDDVALYEWDRVGTQLVALELLSEIDLAAFTLYCTNVSRVVACEKVVREKGMTIVTPAGFEQARPEVSIARQCGVEVRKFMVEFGMTPGARTKVRSPVKPTKAAEKDPWSEIG
jgi:P27 family predicted phage terminase small subunit